MVGFSALTRSGLIWIGLILAFVTVSCGKPPVFTPDDPHWQDNDRRHIADPGGRDPSLVWETVERTSFQQAQQLFDLNRSLGHLTGNRRQAWNINSFDEVPDCAWFTDRHFVNPLTAEEIRRGPAESGIGPDTTQAWTVIRAKVQGVTPGFWIEDVHGNKYILKFDPPDYPEMATGAAAMASRYFHAMGYNVPQETIVYWRPENLRIKEGLKYKDANGVKQDFTDEILQSILDRVHIMPDGRIRSLASLALPSVRGPFSFSGRRKEDPNDWCLHEHRRELRGLYVFASLVNHWDIKDQNTLDIYADEAGRRYLKHYLIDFGSTFGSAGNRPQDAFNGYRNLFDLRDMLVSLFTLGLKTWPWEKAQPIRDRAVGYFEAEIFHPAKWDPIYPIPAFENMTGRDAYWAAKAVMSLRDDDLRALIEAGQYSSPTTRALLMDILKIRRDKIGRHWFSKVNPLDRFQSVNSLDNLTVRFDDLAVTYDLESAQDTNYRYRIRYGGKTVLDWQTTSATVIDISGEALDRLRAVYKPSGDDQNTNGNLYVIEIKTGRSKGGWSKPVLLWFWFHAGTEQFQLVGIEHKD